MTAPKLKPCPDCGGFVAVYTYDSGWRRAECSNCEYIAKPAQNVLLATQNHNARADERTDLDPDRLREDRDERVRLEREP